MIMSAERPNCSACRGVPDLHCGIVRCGRQQPTVGAESRIPDELRVPVQIVDFTAGLSIPNLQHGAIGFAVNNATGAARGDPFAVRAKATGVEIESCFEIGVLERQYLLASLN